MIEGNIFVCSWKRTDPGYRVWVKGRHKLAADGATFDAADQALTRVIGLATGDGESVHEYVPPAPVEGAISAVEQGRVWELGIQGAADMVDATGLFEGGLCTNCLMPRGPRTGAPLAVSTIESRVQASTVSLPRMSPGVGPVLSIYSDEFLAQLTLEERRQFEWRPIVPAKRETREFFELVCHTDPIPYVGLKGSATYFGRCETCGWRWLVPEYVKRPPANVDLRGRHPAPGSQHFCRRSSDHANAGRF